MIGRTAVLTSVLVIVALLAAGCGPGISTAYDAAKGFQDSGDYEAAIAKYQEYAAGNEGGVLVPYAMYNIGRCYDAMGSTAQAVAAYNQLAEQYPASEPARWAEDEMRRLEKAE